MIKRRINSSYRAKVNYRQIKKLLDHPSNRYHKNIYFQEGSIENIVNQLGLKNKTSLYRKEDGAVITNKTMKSIDMGLGCTTSTYQKLLDKLAFQQGFDFHLDEKVSNTKNIDVFTSSYPKSLYEIKKAEFMEENNLKNEWDLYQHFGSKEEYEDQLESEYVESKLDQDLQEIIGSEYEFMKEEDYDLIGYMMELEDSINNARKNLNTKILAFDDESLFDFMYQVESPNRFYDHLCAHNTAEHQNEWLLDNKSLVSLPKNEMSQSKQLELLKKIRPNKDIKIDQAYYERVLNYFEAAGLQKIIRNIIKIIEKTKNFNDQTASTDISQLLEDNENEYKNSFWINYFILRIHSLNIFFQMKNNINQIDEFGLPYQNTSLLYPDWYHAPEKDISFKTYPKFIFYISSCKEDDVFVAPKLASMPINYINFIMIPTFHNEQPYLKSMTIDGFKIPSKDIFIKNNKADYRSAFNELKESIGDNVNHLSKINKEYLKD